MEKIERISVTDKVVSSICSLIKSPEYAVGDRLPPEMAMCEQLGVGRSTIREALRVTQALGLIEIRSGKGAFIRRQEINSAESLTEWFSVKEEEVAALMEVRMAIETLAAKLAVTRGSKHQIEKMQAVHRDFAEAVRSGDIIGMTKLDAAFHESIVEAGNNRLLMKIGLLLSDSFVEYRMRSFAVTENISRALVPHEKILDAIISKNASAAASAVLKHLESSLEDMNRVVGK